MDKHEKKLHKIINESNINDIKNTMKCKTNYIDNNKARYSNSHDCRTWAWNVGEIQVTRHYWLEFGDFALKQFQGYGMKCFRVMNRGLFNGFVIVVSDLFININLKKNLVNKDTIFTLEH
jgi:hypothetical protein